MAVMYLQDQLTMQSWRTTCLDLEDGRLVL
jgi:hypothetical protein